MQPPEPSSSQRNQDILRQALKRKTPIERAAVLDALCGGDAVMRLEMEAGLVRKEEDQGDVALNESVVGLRIEEGTTVLTSTLSDETPVTEGLGTVVGRYKLLEQIGEGG